MHDTVLGHTSSCHSAKLAKYGVDEFAKDDGDQRTDFYVKTLGWAPEKTALLFGKRNFNQSSLHPLTRVTRQLDHANSTY